MMAKERPEKGLDVSGFISSHGPFIGPSPGSPVGTSAKPKQRDSGDNCSVFV